MVGAGWLRRGAAGRGPIAGAAALPVQGAADVAAVAVQAVIALGWSSSSSWPRLSVAVLWRPLWRWGGRGVVMGVTWGGL